VLWGATENRDDLQHDYPHPTPPVPLRRRHSGDQRLRDVGSGVRDDGSVAVNSTDYLLIGLRDGRCVAIAWKQEGKGSSRFNRETALRWLKWGLDILTVHKSHPDVDRYYDELRGACKP
jgi:hypothetical protein